MRLWRMIECWLDSGLVTVTISPSAVPSPTTGAVASGPKRSTIAGDTSAGVTASVRPAPASVSRTRLRTASGSRR